MALARYDCATVMKKLEVPPHQQHRYAAHRASQIIDYLETPSLDHGGRNTYRLNWELLAPCQGSKIGIPAKLIVGDKDMRFITNIFKNLVPDYDDILLLDGHHFIHLERRRPHQVCNEILYDSK